MATNVEQAANATKTPGDQQTRKRIGRYLVMYRNILDPKGELLPPIRYVLTNNESIVASHLFEEGRSSGIAPDPAKVGRATGVSTKEVLDAYELLGEFRFLQHDQKSAPSHYRLSNEGRRLDRSSFIFTQMTRTDRSGTPGRPFNVASPDAGIRLARTRFAQDDVDIQTVCAHCSEQIDLRFNQGKLVQLDPEEPWILIRGEKEAALCFASADHWHHFMATHNMRQHGKALPLRVHSESIAPKVGAS